MDNQTLYNVGFFLLLLALGFVFGQLNERRHFKSIKRREAELRLLIVSSSRRVPDDIDAHAPQLVVGSMVVSVDYFKTFLAAWRNFFGGTMASYETLLERARREAILRMKEKAHALGCGVVFNVRLETSPVFASGARNTTRSIEVLAYGTAVKTPYFKG